jgi:4-amino-4-deoxy-L-arabinose transferase-like glycosyltransferase
VADLSGGSAACSEKACSRRSSLTNFRLVVWLASTFVILLATLVVHSRGLWSPDELRYAQIVQGMHEVSDFFVLKLWDGIYTEKPPLFFWFVRAFVPLTGGVCLVSLLAPIVLASCVLLWLTGHIAWRWYGMRAGQAAIIVLVTLPLFLLLTSIGRMDMLLALCVTAGVYAFHRGYAEDSAWFRLLSFLVMGLGLLSKGPFGIIFPLAVAVTALCISGKWHRLWCRESGWGIAILVVVTACWLAPAVWFAGPNFFAALIGKQVYERAVAGVDHGEPAYFYLYVLPIILLPWVLFLIPALHASWLRWRERRHDYDLWLICWLAVPLVVLSLVREKLPVYLLPAMPPIAVLIGRYWSELFAAGQVSRRFQFRVKVLFAFGALLGLGSLAASLVIAISPAGPDVRRLSDLLQVSQENEIAWLLLDPLTLSIGGTLLVLVSTAGWLGSRTAHGHCIAWTFGTLASVAPCVQLFIILTLMPSLDPSLSWRAVAAAIHEAQSSGEPVVAYGMRPFAAYYLHGDVTWFRKQHSLSEFLQQKGAIWCATRLEELDEIKRCCVVDDRADGRYPSPSGAVVLVRLRPLAVAETVDPNSGQRIR